MPSLFDRYRIKMTLIRDMLATNPCDPNVHDVHIIQKQRSLIMEKSQINREINKYLDQMQISKEKGESEVQALIDKLEHMTGYTFSSEERDAALSGEIEMLKETFKEMDVKGTTVFFWNQEKNLPMIGDHMIYGYLKAASEALSRTVPAGEKKSGTMLSSASYSQSMINQYVRCEEQFITFDRDIRRNPDGSPFYNQRSLRAMTAKGPRVSLAKSEAVPAGAKLDFVLKVFKNSPIKEAHLDHMLAYGEQTGLGQWRSAGFGMFNYTLDKSD